MACQCMCLQGFDFKNLICSTQDGTGWNEFITGKWLPKDGWTSDPFSFVDQFDWEHRRDIEPTKGCRDKGDVYYYQLIDNIRKFKGMPVPRKVSEPKTFPLGDKNAWEDVKPYYRHYNGNTFNRDHWGRYDQYYNNHTGKNDLMGAKVARDSLHLYFLVKTANDISSREDRNWMMLLIDVDRDKSTGWEGYGYIINRVTPGAKKDIIGKNVAGRWEWQKAGERECVLGSKRLEIPIPRKIIDLGGRKINTEFKWNDNMQDIGNIMDFYVNGDTALDGRFNFVFSE